LRGTDGPVFDLTRRADSALDPSARSRVADRHTRINQGDEAPRTKLKAAWLKGKNRRAANAPPA